jgi:outer membrane protein OmpA-like peptidoglycan-associated protein
MRSFLKILMVALVFTLSITAWSQDQEAYIPSPKARKAFEKGLELYRAGKLSGATGQLEKAAGIDTAWAAPYILLADIARDQSRAPDAIAAYRKAISIDPGYSPELYYLLAKVYYDIEQYGDAVAYFRDYLLFKGIRDEKRAVVERLLETALFRKHAMENPVPFEPLNLGKYINSAYDEFVNSITLDEQRLVYTLMQPDSVVSGRYVESFMLAMMTDSGWVNTGTALPGLLKLGNVGAMSLSPDGRFIFFTSCGAEGGYGSCDLYVCGREGNGWGEPVNLGKNVNSESWDSQPCFSADGQTLWFASARPGGYGGSDIWSSRFIPGRGWTEPVNAGPEINTNQEEMAPFIHPDGQTMYFSSKGHIGMGGFDLFVVRKENDGNWAKAVNMGYPVNTASDEINLVVATNGKAAYLSSDIEDGFGGYDIYRFNLPPGLAPRQVSYIAGLVRDAETLEALNAEIELINLASGELVVRCQSDPENGYYIAALPGGKNYALNISRQGYLFYSANFNLQEMKAPDDPLEMDVMLQPLKAGQSMVLNNIFFDTDRYELDTLSRVELEKLYALLIENPGLRILIGGHTDDVGTGEYNQLLSEKRAEAVFNFLVGRGIDPGRLEYRGFGLTRPMGENLTEQGRARNRRTEITVID